ncbi:MAG TPA: type VI secretion system protein TssL, long form [Rhodopila sp.]|nr:type VI secretion system protein TssL, long form [Rhodopila sp.]
MSDNPFLEPNDNERTVVFRPVPGGRPVPPPPARDFAAPPGDFAAPPGRAFAPPPMQSAEPAPAGEAIGPLATGQSPLIIAATPLLQLLGRLRNVFNPPDAGELRARSIQAMRDFETAGRAAAIPHEVLHPARYALCASIDDVVLHTPWGAASPWVQASLVSTFHQEVVSGEGFFHQLAALKRDPARNLALLELMYLCLSLGYQGQYRLSRQGPAQLDQLREDLYQTIVRLRAAYEQGLSPRWRGIEAPYRPARAAVPVWVMALVAVAVVTLSWFFLSNRLNAASDNSLAIAAAAPPTGMPALDRLPPLREPPPPVNAPPPRPVVPPPKPAPSAVVQELYRFLQPEIDRHLVIVTETPQAIQVRIFNSGLFALGSATVRPDFVPLLERIGDALNQEAGSVLVTGHTDDLPIHTVQFPSNFQLSVARAKAASAVMLRKLHDPRRLTAEGRADSEPIHDNATEEHRAENRRIDIILQRRSS